MKFRFKEETPAGKLSAK